MINKKISENPRLNSQLVEMRGIEPLSKSRPILSFYSLSCRIDLSKLRSTGSLSLTDSQDFRVRTRDNARTLSHQVIVQGSSSMRSQRPAFASLCRLLSESVICSVSRYLLVSLTYSYDCDLIQTDPCRIQDIPVNKHFSMLYRYLASCLFLLKTGVCHNSFYLWRGQFLILPSTY